MKSSEINDFIRGNRKLSRKEIAERCGISVNAVIKRERKLGILRGKKLANLTSVAEAVSQDVVKSKKWLRCKELERKYRYALERAETMEARESIRNEMKGVDTYKIKTATSSGHEFTAFLLWSDWHVEERVKGAEVNDVNVYDLQIAQERTERMVNNSVRLIKMFQRDANINKIIVFLGGDFITGNLHEDSSERNQLGTMDAVRFAKKLIASCLQYLRKNTKCEIICICHSGNHGRITKKVHWGTENQNSAEWLMYQDLASHFSGKKHITFTIPEGDMSYLGVYDKNVRFIHGHSVRFAGGVGGLTIPMRKAIAQWDKVKPAMLTCFGHFHQRIHGGGTSAFIGNGSLIGYNAYAQYIKAEYEPPAQQFFLISSRNGGEMAAVCPIWVS